MVIGETCLSILQSIIERHCHVNGNRIEIGMEMAARTAAGLGIYFRFLAASRRRVVGIALSIVSIDTIHPPPWSTFFLVFDAIAFPFCVFHSCLFLSLCFVLPSPFFRFEIQWYRERGQMHCYLAGDLISVSRCIASFNLWSEVDQTSFDVDNGSCCRLEFLADRLEVRTGWRGSFKSSGIGDIYGFRGLAVHAEMRQISVEFCMENVTYVCFMVLFIAIPRYDIIKPVIEIIYVISVEMKPQMFLSHFYFNVAIILLIRLFPFSVTGMFYSIYHHRYEGVLLGVTNV